MSLSRSLKKTLLISASALMALSAGVSISNANASHVHRHVRVHRSTHWHVCHDYWQIVNLKGTDKRFGRSPLSNADLRFAKSYLGVKYSGRWRNRGAKQIARSHHYKAETDNTGFIWGVMKHSGYRVDSTPFAGNMRDYLHIIRAKYAKRGDIVFNRTHSAILLQHYHGKRTKILEMGGSKAKVNISTIGNGFGSLASHLAFAKP